MGSLFKPDKWYETLRKPFFTPPKLAFPIVWTTLYVLMTWSAYRALGGGKAPYRAALAWGLQLSVNAAWSPIMFGWYRVDMASVCASLLWLLVAWTYREFAAVDAVAGYMMLPYLAWVSVAVALSFSIWKLNWNFQWDHDEVPTVKDVKQN
jgi:translocator protein